MAAGTRQVYLRGAGPAAQGLTPKPLGKDGAQAPSAHPPLSAPVLQLPIRIPDSVLTAIEQMEILLESQCYVLMKSQNHSGHAIHFLKHTFPNSRCVTRIRHHLASYPVKKAG